MRWMKSKRRKYRIKGFIKGKPSH